jgi:hypothetical protein
VNKLTGYNKIAQIVREARRKKVHSNLKDAAPELGMGDRKLWEIENGMGNFSPETMHHLGNVLDKRIPRIYCSEICPIGKSCSRVSDTRNLAISTLMIQQKYKSIQVTVFETLPEIACDGEVSTEEMPLLMESRRRLAELKDEIERLELWIELNLEKEKTVSAKTAA